MSEDSMQIGRYIVLEELGSGGFSTVYRVEDTVLGREVALKVMRPLLLSDPTFVARFKREAQVMANLDHPHIVPIHDYGEFEDRLCLVMKLMPGGSVGLLTEEGPLPWEQVMTITEQVASALDYAHERGLIHRDVKPHNVLLDDEGRAALADFGLVRALEAGTITSSLSGGILGTPAYVPPEIWNAEAATPATDVYALACVVYNMATGATLFDAPTPPATMALHFDPPQFPEKWPEGVPPGMEGVLNIALAREAADRYGSAGAFAEALGALAADPLAEPYAALAAAVASERWNDAIALAERIMDQDPGYRDTRALLNRALEGSAAAERESWAAQWREATEAALAAEEWEKALSAARKWREFAPEDEAAAAAVARAEAALAASAVEPEEATAPERQKDPSTPSAAGGPGTVPRRPAGERVRDDFRERRVQEPVAGAAGGLPRWALPVGALALIVLVIGAILLFAPDNGGQPPDATDQAASLTVEAAAGAVEPTEEPAEEPTEEPMEEEEIELLGVSAGSCDYGGKILSIEAVDELTVEFSLCSPDPGFEAKVAFAAFGIYSQEWLEEAAAAAAEGDAQQLLSQPVGTGPYMVEEWVRGDSVIFTRFDDYWGDPAIAETAVLRWATEGAARLLELQSGNVHYITNISPDDHETVGSDPNLQLLQDPNPNILYLAMTNTLRPFDDVRVRRAIAMGIDRQRIVDNFYPSGSEVASHFTPCSIPNGCQGEAWYEFDRELARQLLAEAGYPDGFETSIYYRDVFRVYLPEPGLVAQDLQTQLRENLNIEAEIVVMESGAFIDESTQGNLDGFYLLGWRADYPHVSNFLDFHFGAANLQFGDPHPEIYGALEEANSIADPNEAAPLYEEANQAIKDLVPMVPIVHGAAANAALASLENAYVPPFGAVEFALLDPGGDTLVFMQNAEPISLFCADETDGESLRPCQQIVEPLLKYQLDSGETRPALATGCESNEDASVWTCSLREGVTFHDGSTLDANDVVASWAAGIDASNPLHVGNSGRFDYYAYLWNGLMNVEE